MDREWKYGINAITFVQKSGSYLFVIAGSKTARLQKLFHCFPFSLEAVDGISNTYSMLIEQGEHCCVYWWNVAISFKSF